MNIENLELTFNPVSRDDVTEDFTTAYRTSLRDVIELDAVVVVASGNRNVSPCFFRPATTIDILYG